MEREYMDNFTRMFLAIVLALTVIFASLIVAGHMKAAYKTRKMTEIISTGVDPVRAHIAVYGDDGMARIGLFHLTEILRKGEQQK